MVFFVFHKTASPRCENHGTIRATFFFFFFKPITINYSISSGFFASRFDRKSESVGQISNRTALSTQFRPKSDLRCFSSGNMIFNEFFLSKPFALASLLNTCTLNHVSRVQEQRRDLRLFTIDSGYQRDKID